MTNVRIVRDRQGTPVRLELGSSLEQQLAWQIQAAGLPAPVRELKFIPGRRYRFDFGWPDHKLAVECQGGIWQRGAHSRGKGQERDCEKLALATLQGWRVLAVTGTQIKSGQALAWVEQALTEAA